jgi:hypothetical protein
MTAVEARTISADKSAVSLWQTLSKELKHQGKFVAEIAASRIWL